MGDFDDLFESWKYPPDESWQTIKSIAKSHDIGEKVAKTIIEQAVKDGEAVMKEYRVKSNGRLVPHYKRVKKKSRK